MELYNEAPECWDDQEFVVQTVSKDARCLRLCGDIVRGNKGVIISAVAQNGSSLEYASDELQSDLDVCRTAVQSDGHALYHCSPEMRNDRRVVGDAVSLCGTALEDASAELRADREIVLVACRADGRVGGISGVAAIEMSCYRRPNAAKRCHLPPRSQRGRQGGIRRVHSERARP